MNKKEKATLAKSSLPRSHALHDKQPGKLESMFRHFGEGRRLQRFQTEHLGDNCLHSTVADLQHKHGIHFAREWIAVPNRFGSETRVKVYWLKGESLDIARRVTGWKVAA